MCIPSPSELQVVCPFIKIPVLRFYQMIGSANTILLSCRIIHACAEALTRIYVYTCNVYAYRIYTYIHTLY